MKMIGKRFSRMFYFTPGQLVDQQHNPNRTTYRTMNRHTGEIKECNDLVTLLQTLPYDLALSGGAVTIEIVAE